MPRIILEPELALVDLAAFLDLNSMPEPNSGCRLWTGTWGHFGYGVVSAKLFRQLGERYAHRLSWRAHAGPVPAGLAVLHACDTPPCIEHGHHFLGDRRLNNFDRTAKGRHLTCGVRGPAHHNAKLDAGLVRAIRAATGTHMEIAGRFGISRPNVSLIRGRVTWKHVP